MVLVEYWGFGVRHVQLLLLVICGVVGAILVQTLNVAIHMVEVNLNTNNYTLFDDEFRSHINHFSFEQRYILKNGGTVGRFLASLLAGIYSVRGDRRKLKYFLLVDFTLLSVQSYLIPLVTVKLSFDYLFAMVLFQGFFYGSIHPIITAILARWTPYQEVGRTCTLVLSSRHLGYLCIYVLGLFLRTSIGGWHTLFYIVGNLGLLWCVAWFTFGFQDPKGCFYLSEKEKEFIHNNVKNITAAGSQYRKPIPWANILSCAPAYAALVAQLSFGWLYEIIADTTLSVDLMHFHNSIDMERSMSIQYLVPAGIPVVQFIAALIVDAIVGKNKFPITFVRKTINSIGSWTMTLSLLWLCYDPDGNLEIAFYIFIQYSNCFVNLGSKMVVYDITRDYSGLLDGLIRFVVYLPMAFYIPIMRNALPTAHIHSDYQEVQSHYNIVWYTCAASSMIGNFVFIVMKSRNKVLRVERQPKHKRTSIFDFT